jgi:hypothetical protein
VTTSTRSAPEALLRRATEVLRDGAGSAHEWTDRDATAVTAAVGDHLLALVAALPSNVPEWLVDWQRLARRHGVITTPLVEEPADGLQRLIDIGVRLQEVADRVGHGSGDGRGRPGLRVREARSGQSARP